MAKNGVLGVLIWLVLCGTDPLAAQDTLRIQRNGIEIPDVLTRPVSIDLDRVTPDAALREIAARGHFFINYSESILPPDRFVSLHMKDKPAVTILLTVLKQLDLDFTISGGGQIVIVKREVTKTGRKFTLSGYVTDAGSGEALMGANVFVSGGREGCSSNGYGFYSLTLPEGDYTIRCHFIGYEPEYRTLSLDRNIQLNMGLKETVIHGETVTVTAERADENVTSTEMGTIHLHPQRIQQVPVFLGERDILRTIHLLPGVTPARELDCGFFVRGGNIDQNLILLDEAPVYNSVHFLGTFSVFNSNAIKDVKLIKGPAPSRYGGRLSSVLDIQMNEGNMKELHGMGGIGLIFSNFMIEGPLVKDRCSFMLSGRRTYLDLLAKMISRDARNAIFYFYDFNAKMNYRAGQKDRFYLSGYFGNDVLGASSSGPDNAGATFSWGNQTGTWRWNHLFSDRLFLNTSLIYSRFKYGFNARGDDDVELEYASIVNDLLLKQDFEYFLDPDHTFHFGLQYVHHTYQPARMTFRGDDLFDLTIGKRSADEGAVYLAHIWKMMERLTVDAGLRYSLFSVTGQKDLFDLEGADEADSFFHVDFHEAEKRHYFGFEPRLSINLLMNANSSVKLGYSRNYQNVHLLSASTSGTPLSIWHPSSSKVRPQRSDQVSMGYFRNLKDNLYEMSVELYYKDLKNQIDYANGANFILSSFFESELVFGRGWAYGAEFFLKKNAGRLTGWLSYTCSRSMREYREIDGGTAFPARNDRPHDISLVGMVRLNDLWTFSMNWVYLSGMPVTIPCGNYSVEGRVVHAYTTRNGFRMAPYSRLDIGVTYRTRKHGSWNLTLYNALGRHNPYTLIFRENETYPDRIDAVQLSIVSFVPSITYHFEF